MNREQSLDSIPIDLIIEIHSRLPAKSVARFRSVSKLWCSMLRNPYFTELFLTRSWTRPRLLLALKRNSEWTFFSTPQPQNPYEKSSFVIADFHMKYLPKDPDSCFYNSLMTLTSGLIYFSSLPINKYDYTEPVICNPRTGQYAILPPKLSRREPYSFFGFDPISKKFKVLSVATSYYNRYYDRVNILTLETGKMRWRKIECSLAHIPPIDTSKWICINGVLYYVAVALRPTGNYDESYVIVCFDVGSEKFKFIDIECLDGKLINYKGKLGGISWGYKDNILELSMWILEDVEKKKLSKHVYTSWENGLVDPENHFIVGITSTGEIVLSLKVTSKPFCVFYFNPERNTLQSVKIQGLENDSQVYAFVDDVEDLNVNDVKELKSISVFKGGLNILWKRPSRSRDLSIAALSLKDKQPKTCFLKNKYESLALE
ncbi:putative F-box protein [Cardamine amara subsp. amara]|uniref:F-box protein n=1 Tax=Cardamine amara subsp. amara TaxID=228776 RepID=A0ABD1ANG7_CARAN